jgi:DNA-binding CsgD family transcriptional regulator
MNIERFLARGSIADEDTRSSDEVLGRMTDERNTREIGPLPDLGGADDRRIGNRPFAWPAGLFLAITFFVAADIAHDASADAPLSHLILEIVALVISLVGVVGTALQLRNAVAQTRELQRDLDGTRADLTRWRAEAQGLLEGLGAAIDQQFRRWELTSAECEVALLILKGLSYKEAAEARGTTERTVRHQALSIYRKASLKGRAEMAAFFLEDLLLPLDAAQRSQPERAPTEGLART